MSQIPPAGIDVGKRMGMEVAQETLVVPRPIEYVWRAWTDPDWLAGWHADRVEGAVAAGATVEMHWDSLGIGIALEVVALEPPTGPLPDRNRITGDDPVGPGRLVLRGAPSGRPPQTLTVTLAPARDGTAMTIRHEGLVGEEERAGTQAGWQVSARVLAHYLAHHAGRARRCRAALAPVAASLEDIEPLLVHPAWLLGEVSLGAEGSRFPGGCVLARALPRQIALVLDDAAGILVLRAIRLDPDAALVGAIAWSWMPERPAFQALVGSLAPAVERLAARLGGSRGGAA
jgi:uncharacterized protein YndB with AHSA1/START domain